MNCDRTLLGQLHTPALTSKSREYIEVIDVERRSTMHILDLIASNPGHKAMSVKAHEILNAGIAAALRNGWVEHAPKKAVGYVLTARGKATLGSMRTGIPLPRRADGSFYT